MDQTVSPEPQGQSQGQMEPQAHPASPGAPQSPVYPPPAESYMPQPAPQSATAPAAFTASPSQERRADRVIDCALLRAPQWSIIVDRTDPNLPSANGTHGVNGASSGEPGQPGVGDPVDQIDGRSPLAFRLGATAVL